MNVSSVSSSSGNSGDTEARIKQLEAQLKTVQKQITEENNSDDDSDTKQEKVELYQAQESLINAEIEQIRNQSTQKKQEKPSKESSTEESTAVKEAGKGIRVDVSA
jgi:hypothetical protein